MDRIKFIQTLIFIVAALIVIRLFYWQFIARVDSDSILGLDDIKIPAPRGEIYASDGFPLVANQEAFLIYAKPNGLTKSPQEIAKNLAPFLISEKYSTEGAQFSDEEKKQKDEKIQKKESELAKTLSDKKLIWVQLARKITLDAKQKIEALNISGIDFEKDDKRYYPEASMAAQLLGFVASDKFGDDIGFFGLEGFYDSQLKGKAGRLGQFQDPFGFPILVGDFKPVDSRKGSSLYLTIDRSLQFIVEKNLRDAVNRYGAKEGSIIISQPSSGKILAMATYPTYDPALFTEFEDTLYKNQAVADTYEPGSTFKLITMSAALDSQVVLPDTKCTVCTGPREITGHEISTWNNKYFPDSTMTEVIEHSDNVGMTFVADKLGIDRLYSYIEKFGFNKRTKIDLQEEARGNIRDKEEWRPIDLATASFGQGLAVTPIQMVQAVAAIANSGKLIPPRVVDRIIEDGREKVVKSEGGTQVISSKTAAQITEMMVNAVENGEARAFVPKGYRIAGKTGTAQIPVSGHYDPEKTIATFIGFVPADDPKFVMLVKFTEPSSSQFGSETAAPTFFAISTEILRYLGVSPSEK